MVQVLWTSLVLLITFRESVSQEVNCYSRFDNGDCGDLLGEVTIEDCCLNPHYGYIGADGKCKFCGPASWSEWTTWGRCSVPCKEGVSQRRRECQGQGKCPLTSSLEELQKLTLETKVCIEPDCCPEHGQWSKWGEWQPCSATCEKGMRKRMRTCTEPPPRCGSSCEGPSEEEEHCVVDRVCPTHGGWSNWESWQPCSGTCAREDLPRPTQRRCRSCSNPPPSSVPPGDECPGLGSETRTCDELPSCPVNGNWGPWGPPSSCSVTCGVGVNEMLRQCDNPATKHGGLPCSGSNKGTQICNTKNHCPVDGQWSQWGTWEECKSNRGNIKCRKIGGQQRRQRWCEHTGFVDSKLSEWSEWSHCEPPCGEGVKRTRERKCIPNLSGYPEAIGYPIKAKAYFEGEPKVNCTLLKDTKETLACIKVPLCDT
ncbi:properdin isoform X2 [Oncorhynchus mykiss]|uniref:properdin isoform X2 n=1 Tax=Oncorhynchus mykiss TaxID=8022 RepID=UPI001877D2F2|nr:properdin isoform X2 [Oncorhynchus mykiss]